MTCDCPDFAPNIVKVTAPLMILIARNPRTTPQYDGKRFVFCPWCGKPLLDTTEER